MSEDPRCPVLDTEAADQKNVDQKNVDQKNAGRPMRQTWTGHTGQEREERGLQ
jgi:hypothetical protein